MNSRFGQGTSPRLRQIRESLDALGLKSDEILHHATSRIFYGCELSPHARDALLGLGVPDAPAPRLATWQRPDGIGGSPIEFFGKDTIDDLGRLGVTSVRASSHAEPDGQFVLPFKVPAT